MQYNPYSLEGKTIMVTGASSGIGRGVAVECAKMGARLVLTARNKERLQETLSMLEGDGHQMVVADLTVASEIESLANSLPVLDGLVLNAGVGILKMVGFIGEADIDHVFKTNIYSPMLLNRALLKTKKIKKGASVVFTSSIASLYNTPGNAIYAASKAAVNTYMKTFALELSSKQIRANAVVPGMIETPFIQDGTLSEDDLKKNLESYPLKRYGKPQDIAYAVIYFLSEASSWVTGTTLVVDGGRLLK